MATTHSATTICAQLLTAALLLLPPVPGPPPVPRLGVGAIASFHVVVVERIGNTDKRHANENFLSVFCSLSPHDQATIMHRTPNPTCAGQSG